MQQGKMGRMERAAKRLEQKLAMKDSELERFMTTPKPIAQYRAERQAELNILRAKLPKGTAA